MEILHVNTLKQRERADVLLVPFWKEDKGVVPAAEIPLLKNEGMESPIQSKDFQGKEGEAFLTYLKGEPEPRLLLVGLGDKKKISIEKLRRAYSSAIKHCHKLKLQQVNLLLPEISGFSDSAIAGGATEGVLLTNYVFDALKHDFLKENPTVLVQRLTLVGGKKGCLEEAHKRAMIAEGVYFVRDLVNGNADHITPNFLAITAKELAKKLPHVKTTVFDKKELEKHKMGLLLAVNRGSNIDPAFIMMEYKGDPKSKEKTVLIGKGVTYDTGGLNLKPTGFMETMKCDMAGAATVMGILFVTASLGLKLNLTVVVPATENGIDAKSFKPGDIYQSYQGKTVEIANTDAEGRLVLADAIAYTVKNLKPTRIINFATLTGAIDIALGAEAIGLMSNDDQLANDLLLAGDVVYERACRLPLYEEYSEALRSDFADLKNVGSNRSAGAIIAGKFLQEFVGDVPWAHFDIASTAHFNEPRRYHPKHGTGIGVRLMMEYLQKMVEE